MKAKRSVKNSRLKLVTLISVIVFTSTNALAEINFQGKVQTQRGYPYEGLVNRSEEVKIFYTELAQSITCRVEVLQNGKIWQGEEHSTTAKKFTQKPLRVCMDRVETGNPRKAFPFCLLPSFVVSQFRINRHQLPLRH